MMSKSVEILGYRTWRRWMVADPLFQSLDVTYQNSRSALLFVDELESIFEEMNVRKGTAFSTAGLIDDEKVQRQEQIKQAVA